SDDYMADTNGRSWKFLRPEVQVRLLNDLNERCKFVGASLELCARNWGSRWILRKVIYNALTTIARRNKKTAETIHTNDCGLDAPRQMGDDGDSEDRALCVSVNWENWGTATNNNNTTTATNNNTTTADNNTTADLPLDAPSTPSDPPVARRTRGRKRKLTVSPPASHP
ncbi:hypothetical protein, partial, partial [Absidia glauca]